MRIIACAASGFSAHRYPRRLTWFARRLHAIVMKPVAERPKTRRRKRAELVSLLVY
jgi:hypothetical protein